MTASVPLFGASLSSSSRCASSLYTSTLSNAGTTSPARAANVGPHATKIEAIESSELS